MSVSWLSLRWFCRELNWDFKSFLKSFCWTWNWTLRVFLNILQWEPISSELRATDRKSQLIWGCLCAKSCCRTLKTLLSSELRIIFTFRKVYSLTFWPLRGRYVLIQGFSLWDTLSSINCFQKKKKEKFFTQSGSLQTELLPPAG